MKDFNYCVITGRRWFQKTYGNTYHSVTVTVDGECIGRVDFTYGYEDSYKQTAHAILVKHGYAPEDYNDWLHSTWDNRKKYVITVTDVPRKKDL